MSIAQQHSSNNKRDIVVHVDELLDEQNRRRIEYTMLKATGIERAYFDSLRQHLLIIGYNSNHTNSSKILKFFKKKQINAQLIVGM